MPGKAEILPAVPPMAVGLDPLSTRRQGVGQLQIQEPDLLGRSDRDGRSQTMGA